MESVVNREQADHFSARLFDPAKDSEAVKPWFERMLTEWREQSAFGTPSDACCPGRADGDNFTFEGFVSKLLALFVVENNGEPIGIATLEAVPGLTGVATGYDYSVEPQYQDTGVVSSVIRYALLKHLIEINYRCLQLDTWPDNMKASKVYKLNGFYWAPDTNIHMENHMPMLFNHPAMAEYRKRHHQDQRGWLRVFNATHLADNRDAILTHAPDVYLYNGMHVYPYRWDVKGDSLLFRVSADSKEVISVQRQDLRVDSYIDQESLTLVCEIENRGTSVCDVEIALIKGMTANEWQPENGNPKPMASLQVAPGATETKRYQLRSTGEGRHALAAILNVNGSVFPFFQTFK